MGPGAESFTAIQEDISAHPPLNVAFQTLLDGQTVTFRQDEKTSELRVDPGDVKVLKTVDVSDQQAQEEKKHGDSSYAALFKQAANGRIFYLDGTVKY